MKASSNQNESIRLYLKRLSEIGKVPSSLLFFGPKNAGKELVAEELAKELVGGEIDSHPDVFRYKPEGKIGMHGVDTIRHLREEAYLPPYKSAKKVFLIFEAERMLPYSANALLKIFEEPPLYNTIVLISSYPEKILPTILSRCHAIPFRGDASYTISVNTTLLSILRERNSLSYPNLLKKIKQLLSEIELQADSHGQVKDLTAYQLQQIEKQKEGTLAMQLLFFADALFEQILGWFRDMVLMQLNGSPSLLYHKDHSNEVKQACQKGEFFPLEKLQQLILEARLSLERSTPIQNVFEHFFLNLSKIF